MNKHLCISHGGKFNGYIMCFSDAVNLTSYYMFDLLQVAPDISLYNAVIQGMCLRGKFESAKKLYTRMRESGLKPDGKTRALMLQNLQRKI